MAIPEVVKRKLRDAVYQRPRGSNAEDVMAKLGIDLTSEFAEFYKTYRGGFDSRKTGFELLDLEEEDESVLSSTEIVRKEFSWPIRFIVISTYLGNGVLVYDTESNNVFDVDFEGGDALLLAGKLEPYWNTWNDFLSFYFGE